jgi:hypothetical protein
MKKNHGARKVRADGLLPEYRFDYREAKPNRFAARYRQGSRVIVLDPDIAKVFTTAESVNTALRALLKAMPRGAS